MYNSLMLTLPANTLGEPAGRLCAAAHSAAVLGVTSRGIFIKTDQNWVLFLSYEAQRGPLTLNLEQAVRPESLPQVGSSIEFQSGELVFPISGLRLSIDQARVWRPPARPEALLPPAKRRELAAKVVQTILARRGAAGLTAALGQYLNLAAPVPSAALHPFSGIDLHALRTALGGPDPQALLARLEPLYGLGSGLTPSGDDLIAGLLLALSRYPELLPRGWELAQMVPSILKQAYQKTSLLSANLIECAAEGQADERLILALDGLLAGTLEPTACAQLLLNWGSTSGCDALAGMALAAV